MELLFCHNPLLQPFLSQLCSRTTKNTGVLGSGQEEKERFNNPPTGFLLEVVPPTIIIHVRQQPVSEDKHLLLLRLRIKATSNTLCLVICFYAQSQMMFVLHWSIYGGKNTDFLTNKMPQYYIRNERINFTFLFLKCSQFSFISEVQQHYTITLSNHKCIGQENI